MTSGRAPEQFLSGIAEMRSPPFSRLWKLTQNGDELLQARRHVWHRSSIIQVPPERWAIVPEGWGTYLLVIDDEEAARAVSEQWRGKRWVLVGRRPFTYELWSESMIRRHWSVGQVGQPILRIAGARTNFNRMTLTADLAVPLQAVALAWHIVVRAWEASGRGEAV